jgi:hypothetical protein
MWLKTCDLFLFTFLDQNVSLRCHYFSGQDSVLWVAFMGVPRVLASCHLPSFLVLWLPWTMCLRSCIYWGTQFGFS